ncbi:MAG: hypothetical protein KC572_14720 [Gammaproteobacteria bacterium]|nr:hypothetical protein [Gammaproteobacteria bacterium]
MSKSKNKSLFVTWLTIMLASATLADVDRSIAGLSERGCRSDQCPRMMAPQTQ